MKKSKSKGYLSLFVITTTTFLITFPAGFVTRAALDPWYYNLVKPEFSPTELDLWTSMDGSLYNDVRCCLACL